MGNLKNILNNKLEATDALVFYKSTMSNGGAYVEHRPIKNGLMGAGAPLEVSVLSKMMKAVDKYAVDTTTMVMLHGVIPENLLYASGSIDSYRLVWYRKPEKRMMYFIESLGIQNGEMEVPGLVYSTDGRGLKVFAFKGNKPKKVLFHAPFFNVSDHVCLGSAKIAKPKDQTYQNWIQYWEDMFWKSEFAHILGENPIKGNLSLVTKECISGNKPFPAHLLKKSKYTLQRLYEI